MLLKCCLMHISIIMLRHFFYLLYLRPCLDPLDCIYVICFSFLSSLRLIVLSYEYTHTRSFAYFSEYVLLFLDDNVVEECE